MSKSSVSPSGDCPLARVFTCVLVELLPTVTNCYQLLPIVWALRNFIILARWTVSNAFRKTDVITVWRCFPLIHSINLLMWVHDLLLSSLSGIHPGCRLGSGQFQDELCSSCPLRAVFLPLILFVMVMIIYGCITFLNFKFPAISISSINVWIFYFSDVAAAFVL